MQKCVFVKRENEEKAKKSLLISPDFAAPCVFTKDERGFFNPHILI